MLSNATTEVDRRTLLHVPSGTPWSTSSVEKNPIDFVLKWINVEIWRCFNVKSDVSTLTLKSDIVSKFQTND